VTVEYESVVRVSVLERVVGDLASVNAFSQCGNQCAGSAEVSSREYRLVPCGTETEELESENLAGIPW
jgi:hypothetical protein